MKTCLYFTQRCYLFYAPLEVFGSFRSTRRWLQVCCFFCMLGGSFELSAQDSYQLRGYIRESLEGSSLEGVHLQAGAAKTASDARGYFEIEVASVPVELICTSVGYDTLRLQITGQRAGLLMLEMQLAEIELETIVINSLRQDRKAPFSSTLLTQKSIESTYIGENGPMFMQYYTPSLLVVSDAGTSFGNYTSNLTIRGMGVSRINLSLAGVPLNDMLDHGFYFSNFNDMMESASSVEVQRGVGGSTQGSAAYGGSD